MGFWKMREKISLMISIMGSYYGWGAPLTFTKRYLKTMREVSLWGGLYCLALFSLRLLKFQQTFLSWPSITLISIFSLLVLLGFLPSSMILIYLQKGSRSLNTRSGYCFQIIECSLCCRIYQRGFLTLIGDSRTSAQWYFVPHAWRNALSEPHHKVTLHILPATGWLVVLDHFERQREMERDREIGATDQLYHDAQFGWGETDRTNYVYVLVMSCFIVIGGAIVTLGIVWLNPTNNQQYHS